MLLFLVHHVDSRFLWEGVGGVTHLLPILREESDRLIEYKLFQYIAKFYKIKL